MPRMGAVRALIPTDTVTPMTNLENTSERPFVPAPMNGAMVALITIGTLGVLAGLILVLVGANTPVKVDYITGESSAGGLVALVWGGALLNIGFFGLFGALVAKAARP